jgi:hypothetical protein
MTELFNLYYKDCEANGIKPLSRGSLSNLFREMNLSIHPIKKDRCDVCIQHEVGQISDEARNSHIKLKNRARLEKSNDKILAERKQCRVLTMDVEAVKVSPFIQASAAYFRMKLCCHNFTIYDLASWEVVCFWFDETAADLSSSTFVTCVIEYLNDYCKDSYGGPIIIFSDGCCYQNRNANLSNALLWYSVEKQVEIIQKFLVVGHTQMECDSVHARIEEALKGKEIFIPYDYIRITQDARKRPSPYIVRRMVFSDFKSYASKQHQKYASIRPGKVLYDIIMSQNINYFNSKLENFFCRSKTILQ